MGSAHPLVQQEETRLPLTTLASFSESGAPEDPPFPKWLLPGPCADWEGGAQVALPLQTIPPSLPEAASINKELFPWKVPRWPLSEPFSPAPELWNLSLPGRSLCHPMLDNGLCPPATPHSPHQSHTTVTP